MSGGAGADTGAAGPSGDDAPAIRVLNLVTTPRSFYRKQEAALDAAGIEYTTLEVPGEHRNLDDRVEERTPKHYAQFLPQVLSEAWRGDYDLVHANFGLTAPFALAQLRLPVVVSLWGGEFRENPFTPLIEAATARADEVIVPSRMMRRFVDRETHLIPYPIDTEQFQPMDRREARERLGWDPDETVVFFPAAPGREEKDFPLAERVVDGIDSDVRLHTAGSIPYDEMPLVMNASNAVLCTSKRETGPMIVKEAAACNVPVVSRPVGFVPEVLDGVTNSYVADDEDGLREGLRAVLDDDGRADGRGPIASYGTAEMGEALRQVYERVLPEEKRRPEPAIRF
ncbi:glycosyltransferase family 4 protein [Halobium salinum]|uniref:Glycosyltransferase family 4 protein n=1 Tax=Halobium salinum TaxID=1364940 RepID=A0ABD5PGQ3_9EURY|nr:glycosyltransferase family 4 protein [Halobium salinum]